MTIATVLLVDDEVATLSNLEAILARDKSLRVITARSGADGLARAQELRPDLIISDYEMPEMNGFELCQAVKADPSLETAIFIVLSGFTDPRLKVQGFDLGVDDYLVKPIDPAELAARIRAVLRIKRLHDQLREDKAEMAELHGTIAQSFESLLALLIHLLDLTLPGAADRGKRLASLVLDLAQRFAVPEEFHRDLQLAALLQEIGKVVASGHHWNTSHHAQAPNGADWQYTVVTADLLEDVERLRGAAELVRSIYENWDGTGMPSHFKSGQIPLRSRLLRVCIDFTAAVEGAGPPRHQALSPADALTVLQAHRGTWYDPLVLVHLESALQSQPDTKWAEPRRHVIAEDLKEGMVLANDLLTSSGVKLLSSGATITRSTLDIILRRHAVDPIVQGAWIRKP
jgi:response regulator RpfG family c-di-GMP phosphodiesterase